MSFSVAIHTALCMLCVCVLEHNVNNYGTSYVHVISVHINDISALVIVTTIDMYTKLCNNNYHDVIKIGCC